MILKELKYDRYTFLLIFFLTILQMFIPKVMLIRDQVLINVSAMGACIGYSPKG